MDLAKDNDLIKAIPAARRSVVHAHSATVTVGPSGDLGCPKTVASSSARPPPIGTAQLGPIGAPDARLSFVKARQPQIRGILRLRRLAVILIAGILAVVGSSGLDLLRNATETIAQTRGQSNDPPLRSSEAKGHELRAAIATTARDIPSGAKLSLVRSWRTGEISQNLESLLPVGLSFDEAEEILLRAGFSIVQTRLEPYVLAADHPDSYSVRATLDLRIGDDYRAARVDAILVPREPGNYSVVGVVRIDIKVTDE